ncbi:hypothetical protein FKP32DRAFT_1559945, partial [Trametes sanguinea]
LHPVFHVSLLKPYNSDSDFHAPSDPVPFGLADDDSSPLIIKAILDSWKLGQRYEYLVSWQGLSEDENSWVPLSDMPITSNELLERFHRRHPRAPRPPHSLFNHSAHSAFENTNNNSPSDPQIPPTAPPASSAPPAPPASSAPPASPASSAPHAPAAPPTRRPPAIPPAAPRPRSPPPLRENPRVFYTPPTQTTLRSGRVSRPPRPRDA